MNKIFRLADCKDKLFFTNQNREDEYVIFNRILDILQEIPTVVIGDRETGPSEDMYEGYVDGREFTLLYDIDYGGYLYSKYPEVLDVIENVLNS